MNNDDVPFVIGEIGINHNGDIGIAMQLIDMAAEAGCNAVKFQKRTIEAVYTPQFLSSHRESPWGNTQRDQKEGLEFGSSEYDQINDHCKNLGIQWSASSWDLASQKFLHAYDLSFNKIASAMITHRELLNEVASEKKPTYISTGMSSFEDIDRAVEIFTSYGCPFVLLHCVSIYPCDAVDVNIDVIRTLQKRYGVDVGYSGHERGLLPTILAVSMGATVIERHITLDRTMYGSDQSASLENQGLVRLVRDIRKVKIMQGNGDKLVLIKEIDNAKKLRYWE